MSNIKVKDIVWLAGLLEGEASFGYYETANISLGMTDYDIVRSVAHIMSIDHIIFTKRQKDHYKDRYTISLNGVKAIEWMMTLYPLMHDRRKNDIKAAIDIWKSKPYGNGAGAYQRAKTHCPQGHEYSKKNTAIYNNRRKCIACNHLYREDKAILKLKALLSIKDDIKID